MLNMMQEVSTVVVGQMLYQSNLVKDEGHDYIYTGPGDGKKKLVIEKTSNLTFLQTKSRTVATETMLSTLVLEEVSTALLLERKPQPSSDSRVEGGDGNDNITTGPDYGKHYTFYLKLCLYRSYCGSDSFVDGGSGNDIIDTGGGSGKRLTLYSKQCLY